MDAYKKATTIVKKLAEAGYIAYFAGGWVRDHVMGHPSEDIDIATNASPQEIMEIFPHTILVGLAFGVVIIPIEGHQFEVATFRKDLHYTDGRRPTGIEMATPHEDAQRRDFTINGMFYDPIEHVIHDYVNGREDISKGIIRTIGDPYERFFEDRLRMLRAFRFAARFAFTIEPVTLEAIHGTADKLFPAVAMERVWQEFNKMVAYPRFDQAIVEMHRTELLDIIFPEMKGLHIKDLRHLVSSYAHFPPATPTVLYLMELLPQLNLEQKINILRRMKTTGHDIKMIEYFEELSNAIKSTHVDDFTWAHLYANPRFEGCLHVIAARLTEQEKNAFLYPHTLRQEQLKQHIDRIISRKTVLNADFLQHKGMVPGKLMGQLIKEGEKMAINDNLLDAHLIFKKLKTMPVWMQNS